MVKRPPYKLATKTLSAEFRSDDMTISIEQTASNVRAKSRNDPTTNFQRRFGLVVVTEPLRNAAIQGDHRGA